MRFLSSTWLSHRKLYSGLHDNIRFVNIYWLIVIHALSFRIHLLAVPPSSVRIWVKKLNNANSGDPKERHKTKSGSRAAPFGVTEDIVTVRAGHDTYLVCESTGSRPQAVLKWSKNGLPVTSELGNNQMHVSPPQWTMSEAHRSTPWTKKTSSSASQWSRNGGQIFSKFKSEFAPYNDVVPLYPTSSVSLSTFKFIPNYEDHKVTVSCQAVNEKLPAESLKDEVVLNVLCEYAVLSTVCILR